MEINESQVVEAVRYNRAQRYSATLVRKIQRLVGTAEDGDAGRETARAVARWQDEEELHPDGKIGPETLCAMEDVWRSEERIDDDDDEDENASDDDVPAWAIDMSGLPRRSPRGEPKGTRPWHQITGITLHQTAVDFGGPEHPRLTGVPVHAMTFQDGRVALLNPPTALMYHGNGFNQREIGIEVSCRAAGIEGVFTKRRGDRGANTFWRSPATPDIAPLEASDVQIEATRNLVRYYLDLVKNRGGEVKYIHAHRQSSRSRVSDPGSRIWRLVGVWAQTELGLSAGGPGWCLDKGLPIPTAWDPRHENIPYSAAVRGFDRE